MYMNTNSKELPAYKNTLETLMKHFGRFETYLSEYFNQQLEIYELLKLFKLLM